MTPPPAKMIRERELHRKSPSTIEAHMARSLPCFHCENRFSMTCFSVR